MIWQQTLDELRALIEGLERDLAETDSMLATHASTIDTRPAEKWPPGSILRKAIDRHCRRELVKAQRAAGQR